MGNLLIVDDEPDILETLAEMFKYESELDIDVYVAKSASVALGLLERIKFDVVMTDIKMPGMSGIELYRRIKENWPKCRVIFLTGYRDFDTLYEISSFKDVRYLQKSESDEVLIRTVSEAFDEIEEMMRMDHIQNEQHAKLVKAQSIVREKWMQEYLHGERRGELTQEELDRSGIPLRLSDCLFLFLVQLDRAEGGCESASYEMVLERQYFLEETIREFLPPRFSFYLYDDGNGSWLLFLQPIYFTEESLSARVWKRLYANLTGAVEYVQERAFMAASLSLSFVTCDDRCRLQDARSYLTSLKREAIIKINRGEQKIVMAQVRNEQLSVAESAPKNVQLSIRQMEEALERKAFPEFMEILRALTGQLARLEEPLQSAAGAGGTADNVVQREQATELYYSISLLLLRYINLHHIRQKLEEELPLRLLINIEDQGGLQEAADYLQKVANRMIEETRMDGKHRTDEVLEKVTDYIDSHIAENLTLTRIAEICYLNPSYLSRVFKQKYGCNITEYISRARLEQAKKLLTTTSIRVGEIALQVGYLTSTSFTRVFRKVIGMSPVEYRNRYGEQNHAFGVRM